MAKHNLRELDEGAVGCNVQLFKAATQKHLH